MTVKEFVEDVSEVTIDSLKEKRINSLLKPKKYVSIVDKINLADKVSKAATHEFDKDGNIIGFKINSLTKYILHVMGLIELYTDIDVDRANILKEYDLLNENGLIEVIINLIGEHEIAECQMCLNMIFDDTIQNEMSTEAFVKSQVERFGTLVGTTLSPAINGFTEAISKLDNEKIEQIIGMVEKEKE